jgi:hypothetical protein
MVEMAKIETNWRDSGRECSSAAITRISAGARRIWSGAVTMPHFLTPHADYLFCRAAYSSRIIRKAGISILIAIRML